MAPDTSAQISKRFQKTLAGVVMLPIGAAAGQVHGVATYAEQTSGTPDRSWAMIYKEAAQSPVPASTTQSVEFNKQLAEFASATERSLQLLQAQVTELATQVGELSRSEAYSMPAAESAHIEALPEADGDWAELFYLAADAGVEPLAGVAKKAASILRSDRDDALVIAAARALAVLDRSHAKSMILGAKRRLKTSRIADRLGLIVADYNL